MTKAERAACLRAAAMARLGVLDAEWDAYSETFKRQQIAEIRRNVSNFLAAAAALPNPEKLVARVATEGMIETGWEAMHKQVEFPEDLIPRNFSDAWTAAHDAAAKWEEG